MKKTIVLALTWLCFSNVWAQGLAESNDFSYPLKLYEQEFYDLAAQQFIRFYNQYPQSAKVPDAKYYAGMSFFNIEKYEDARIEFQSLAIEYPKNSKAGESWYKAGQCNVKLENLREATKSFETIRLLYPDDLLAPKGLYEAGNIYIQLEDYEKAFQVFSVILERYSNSSFYVAAQIKSGRALYHLGEAGKARKALLKSLDTQNDEKVKAEAYFYLAKIETAQGYLDKAKNYYRQITRDYPKTSFNIEALYELSLLLLQENNLKDAQQYLNRGIATQLDEKWTSIFHHLLGDVYYLSEKYALAEKEYIKINTVDKDSLGMVVSLKVALTRKKQNFVTKAIDQFRTDLENYQDKTSAFYGILSSILIDWLEQKGKNQDAISILYERLNSISTQSERIPLSLRLANLLIKTERWREVIRELQPLLLVQDKYPEKDDIVYFYALALEKISRYEESAYYYKQLISEYSSSAHSRDARERLQYLIDYQIVDKGLAVNRLAGLIGKMVNNENNSQMQFELGKIYYSDLKDYKNAELQFKQAFANNPVNLGDLNLLLGKTYLKLAGHRDQNQLRINEYLDLANKSFKSAVEHIATSSSPDEASWLMVKTSIGIDTVDLAQEKRFTETLINRYPHSPFLEKWYESLAFSLAFDPAYATETERYFKILIDKFKRSENYPSYLSGFAKLLQPADPQAAINYYKEIASDFPFSFEAAGALYEVANHFAAQGNYADANTLYNKLVNFYYYSDLAETVRLKLGPLYQKAGQYDKAITFLTEQIDSPFTGDYVLTREFMSEDLYDNVYLLARSYSGKGESEKALHYLKLYLNVVPRGKYRDLARFDIGEIFYSNNQRHIALDNFKSVSKDNADLFVRAQLYSAEIYFELEDYQQAAGYYNDLKKQLQGSEQEKDVYGKYIISLLRSGSLKESNSNISIYKSKFPKASNYLAQFVLELGNYYRIKKDFNKAQKYFKDVKKKHKSSEYVDDADYSLALTYVTLNKTEDAFKILSNFFTNYPNSDKLPAALNTLGSLYYRSEKYDSAISMFKKALLYCKEPVLESNIMSNLIKTYSLTGFWDAAQGMARQYVDKFAFAEDRLDKKIVIAQAYINLNQFQNAVEYLRKIKLEADSEREPEIQFYIGEALLKAGQYENAIAEFVKIPLLSKKTKLQWEASALYYSGQSYEKLGRTQDAVRMYQEIVRRPGIDLVLKKDAEKRIKQIQ